ncbi:MAG: hypothetical protein K2Q18_13490 [Bdellovibrionales bacterium]|nr:hypothetical protein [Bdellovibrionales bacterium]
MKTHSYFLGLFLLLSSQAFAANGDVTPQTEQCSAVMDSKVYLSSDFHGYPRNVKFECTYICNKNGKLDKLTGISEMTVSTMEDDALSPVCQGVTLKKVPWGYDFDKIIPFYAPDTKILELKRWAFQNISFNSKTSAYEKEKLIKLKTDLYTISSSFIMAGMNGGTSSYFKEAGIKISEIADQLPEKTTLLDEEIQQIIVNKGINPPGGTAESLIFMMIKNSAEWRIPTHLFK